MMKNLSVIIPSWKRKNSIHSLIKRLDRILTTNSIKYEIIFVDNGDEKIRSVKSKLYEGYPVQFPVQNELENQNLRILQSVKLAKYPTIAFIDKNYIFPLDKIPQMLTKIQTGADVVVGKRIIENNNLLSFHNIFERFLHRLDYDTQSGLVVFKKDVLDKVNLTLSSMALNLEFLIKAQSMGFRIEQVEIEYVKKRWELYFGPVFSALRLWWFGLSAMIEENISEKSREILFKYKGVTFNPQTNLQISETAIYRVTTWQKTILVCLTFLSVGSFFINWHFSIVVAFSILTILYFSDLLFNLFLIFRSFFTEPIISVSKREINQSSENLWPTYTILCPLYKEWEMLPQFVKAISELDYPKKKLQVLLLLEEDDITTINKVRSLELPKYFQALIVPNSIPKTKPKACNFGLSKALGEYTVVYDAEDIPDPDQLKKAMIAFKKSGSRIGCIQAKLNFYNPNQNILTRLFTLEYSLWFDLVLTGLQSINAPIPLGGTSNHFKTKHLKSFSGWDPFNVTEDADLGIRLVKRGYKTAIVDSTTWEEANSDFKNWFDQRTRWIKGYIQTYLVHMREPQKLLRGTKKLDLLTFQLIIGGKVLSMIINPFMWLLTFSYFIFRGYVGTFIESLYIMPIFYTGVFCLIVGNFLYMYYYMIGAAKRNQWTLVPFTLLIPIYWLMMSLAAFRAFYELLTKPYYWHKTQHGLHLNVRKGFIENIFGEISSPQVAFRKIISLFL